MDQHLTQTEPSFFYRLDTMSYKHVEAQIYFREAVRRIAMVLTQKTNVGIQASHKILIVIIFEMIRGSHKTLVYS